MPGPSQPNSAHVGQPMNKPRIFCAIDTPDLDAAIALATSLGDAVDGVKLGLEFFGAQGPAGVAKVAALGMPVFLDLKLHDIPNTVARAVRGLLPLAPSLLTVHAAGGPAMLEAAAEAAAEAGAARPRLVAVTVLTSLGDGDLAAVGFGQGATASAHRLAAVSQDAGIDGIVCSGHEAAAMRTRFGPGFVLVVPGIRPASAAVGDQKRVMTPRDAASAGADVLVIGRPITEAADPAAAARAIARELAGNGTER